MEGEEKRPEAQEPLEPQDSQEKEPIRWATRRERIVALVLAVVVILITLAYTYAIATGQLFRY